MSRLLALNKPFGVICQFSRDGDRPTLADFVRMPQVYPAGRLDTDSEGLLLLTDHGPWQARISEPRFKMDKTYLAQVEGVPDEAALAALRTGVTLKDGPTLPCGARRVDEPQGLWPRDPPIRYRAAIPTAWIELVITEGRNRQVRRMTAAVGHPTLRLIRTAIGPWGLEGLAPGEWREVDTAPLGASKDARAPRRVPSRPQTGKAAARPPRRG
jgi:23S rRNA pseudouridine2457 synthase